MSVPETHLADQIAPGVSGLAHAAGAPADHQQPVGLQVLHDPQGGLGRKAGDLGEVRLGRPIKPANGRERQTLVIAANVVGVTAEAPGS